MVAEAEEADSKNGVQLHAMPAELEEQYSDEQEKTSQNESEVLTPPGHPLLQDHQEAHVRAQESPAQSEDRSFANGESSSSCSAQLTDHGKLSTTLTTTADLYTAHSVCQRDPLSEFADSLQGHEMQPHPHPRPQPEIFTAETILDENMPQQQILYIPRNSSAGPLRGIDGNIDSRTNSPLLSPAGSSIAEEEDQIKECSAAAAFTAGEVENLNTTESSTTSVSMDTGVSSERSSTTAITATEAKSQRYSDKHGLLKKMRNSLRKSR